MKIGAHVSSSGGVYKAIDRAEEIGAEAIQVFVSGPTTWRVKTPDDAVVAKYRERVEATEIDTAFFHGVYLINLGSPNPELVDKGVDSLIKYQTAADKIGCQGTIFHVGSHKGRGFETVLPSDRRVLPPRPRRRSGRPLADHREQRRHGTVDRLGMERDRRDHAGRG